MSDCILCKGTGFVNYTKGDRQYVRRCECAIQEIIKRNIPEIYLKEWQGDDKNLKAGLDFLDSIEKVTCVLYGPTGAGKTFLGMQMLKEYGIRNNFRHTRFVSAPELSNILHLMGCGGSNREDIEGLYYKLVEADFILIDDFFGKPRERTDESIADFTSFWDLMLRNAVEKIVITTNWNPESFKNQCDTIYSRLLENSTWIEMAGKDWRSK